MKYFLLCVIVWLFVPFTLLAQSVPPVIKSQQSFGGSGNDEYTYVGSSGIGIYPKLTLNDTDGYVIAGESNSKDQDVSGNHGLHDIWVAKINRDRSIKWSISLGGSSDEVFSAIKKDIDGGYIISGMTKSRDGDVRATTGREGAGWLIKLDSLGHLVWNKSFESSQRAYFGDVQVVGNTGYVMIGFVNTLRLGNQGSSDDMWVVRVDRSGNELWQKGYGGLKSDADAGNIQVTADGGFIVAGMTNSSEMDVSGFHGGNELDIWVVKLDQAGSIQWSKCLGGTGSEIASNIVATKDGGYIVVGRTNSSDGDISNLRGGYDAWAIKLSATGAIQWQKTYGGFQEDGFSDIIEQPDGTFITSGFTSSAGGDVKANHGRMDYWLVKLDATGLLLWEETYGGSGDDICVELAQTSDNEIMLIGESNSNDQQVSGNHGLNDLWVVSLTYPSILPVTFIDVAVTSRGNLVALINWHAKDESNTRNYEIQKSDDGLVFSSLQTQPSKNSGDARYAALDTLRSQAKIFYRIKAVDLNGKTTYSRILLFIPEYVQGLALTLFPNPVVNNISVNYAGIVNGTVRIFIRDLSGKRLVSVTQDGLNTNHFSTIIPVDQLKNGIYMLELIANGNRISKTFIRR